MRAVKAKRLKRQAIRNLPEHAPYRVYEKKTGRFKPFRRIDNKIVELYILNPVRLHPWCVRAEYHKLKRASK